MSVTSILSVNAGEAVLKVFLLLIGFVLLVKGADFFVDGASGIAKKLKVSTFIIGVTVVALGTSAPEAAVTIMDCISGSGELIVGNILGSNIINVFLILGLSALVCNLPVEKTTRFIDIPFLVLISALFIIFGYTGNVFEWWEGLILLLLYAGFMAYTIVLAKKQSKLNLEQASAVSMAAVEETPLPENFFEKIKAGYVKLKEKVWFLIFLTVIGLAMVVGGAQLVVTSAEYIAKDLVGLAPEIVALTVVAFGTSLPELVTSVSAARKGDVGIATGNIIGSNIANILLIGGLGAVCSAKNGLLFSPEGLVSGLVSLLASLIIFGFSFGKKKSLGKIAGGVMLACLVSYYLVVFLNFYNVINIY